MLILHHVLIPALKLANDFLLAKFTHFFLSTIFLHMIPRVHNISREGECLTAYTCFKRTALSTESTPPGVN